LGKRQFEKKWRENKIERRQGLFRSLGWNRDFPRVCEEPLKSIMYCRGVVSRPLKNIVKIFGRVCLTTLIYQRSFRVRCKKGLRFITTMYATIYSVQRNFDLMHESGL
jgi:hypothetical protein